jgi:hypothetical protein
MRFSSSDHAVQVSRRLRELCRTLSLPLLMAGCMAASLSAAPLIQYQTTSLGVDNTGSSVFRFTYTLSGIDLPINQEFDIEFDPTVFTQLANGVTGPGFDLLLFQPNQPVGVEGDYSDLATVNHPSLTGTFSVDATLAAGITAPPISQPFIIFDDNMTPSTVVFQGTATATVAGGVPEPWSFLLSGGGLLTMSAVWAVRRRNT